MLAVKARYRYIGLHPVRGYLGCVLAKKRYFMWILFFVVLTGTWNMNTWLSYNKDSPESHYVSKAGNDSLIAPNATERKNRSLLIVPTATSTTALHNRTTGTHSKLTSNKTSSLESASKSKATTSYGNTSATSRAPLASPGTGRGRSFKLFNITDFTYLHNNATACQGKSFIVVVHTAIGNHQRRQVIRNIWGKHTPVFFMLGRSMLQVDNTAIAKESAQYNDIVQGSFLDTYRNLTYKHVMALQWALDYCPNTSFILKADDDYYINLELLQKYVSNLRRGGNSFAEGNCSDSLMLCNVFIGGPVLRADGNKWKVTKEEFQRDTYPPYCSGWGIVYSRKAASCLLGQLGNVPFLWIDDVYVSGLLAEAAKVIPTRIEPEALGPAKEYFKEKLDFSRLEKFANKTIMGPGGLDMEEMNYLAGIVSLFRCPSQVRPKI